MCGSSLQSSSLTTANSPPPKDCHFQATGRTPLGVWESQKNFAKIFPKNSHEPHFYVQLLWWQGKVDHTWVFFHEKNYRKKMSQKVTKLFSKKKYDFSFFFSKKKIIEKKIIEKKCRKKKMRFSFFFSKKKLSKKNVTKSDQTLQ